MWDGEPDHVTIRIDAGIAPEWIIQIHFPNRERHAKDQGVFVLNHDPKLPGSTRQRPSRSANGRIPVAVIHNDIAIAQFVLSKVDGVVDEIDIGYWLERVAQRLLVTLGVRYGRDDDI